METITAYKTGPGRIFESKADAHRYLESGICDLTEKRLDADLIDMIEHDLVGANFDLRIVSAFLVQRRYELCHILNKHKEAEETSLKKEGIEDTPYHTALLDCPFIEE
jgi:hypothetical protein